MSRTGRQSAVSLLELIYVCAVITFLVLAAGDAILILRAARITENLGRQLAAAAARQSSEVAAMETVSRLAAADKQDGFFIKNDVTARVVSYLSEPSPPVPEGAEKFPERLVTVEVSLSAWVPAPFLFHVPGQPSANAEVVPGMQPDTVKLSSCASAPLVDLTTNPKEVRH